MPAYLILSPLVDPGELPTMVGSPESFSSPSLSFLVMSTVYHLPGITLFLLFRIIGPDPVSNLKGNYLNKFLQISVIFVILVILTHTGLTKTVNL